MISCHQLSLLEAWNLQALAFEKGRRLPRYFFHFSDGKRQFSDSSGVELSGMAAARANATRQVRELKVAMCHPNVQDLSTWTMTVTDAKKRPIFKLPFDNKRPRSEG